MRLDLFPFRHRDPRTGQAEIRDVDAGARAFSPHRSLATRSHLPVEEPPPSDPPQPEKEPGIDPPVKEPPETDPPVKEPPSEEPATLEGVERMLLLVFLRRYVTYCARLADHWRCPRREPVVQAHGHHGRS